jgi:RNA polymerase sigma factor (sigma-70 family)
VRRRQRDLAVDRARFEDVYRKTRVPVLAYLLRRTTDPEDAADLLADVYLVAWRRIDDLPRGDEARLWLFGVARRVLANHRRKKRSESGLAGELQINLRLPETNSDASANDSSADAVRAALEAMGEKDRELLMLSAWEDLNPSQIAAVVDRPIGLVRVQLHRARRKLGELMATGARTAPPAVTRAPAPAARGCGDR